MEVQKKWTAPSSKPRDGLKVYNTLSGTKVPFLTKDGSRHVTWYNCGPTVYDTSHLGHARNYLTFDIMRRILEAYFGYKVRYVMNVTDVDDKIINRARRKHLLDRYLAAASDPRKVRDDLVRAFQSEITNQQEKVAETQEELAFAKSSRKKEDLEEKLKQEQLKLSKVNEAWKAMEEKVEKASTLGGKAGVNLILLDCGSDASDVLASQLDTELGAEITDHAIFQAHSSKYEKDFFDDMGSLGVRPPNVITRVTEYIGEIIMYVERIIDQGFGYHANGSIYFDTKAFINAGHTYGKLNPWAVGSAGLASESEANFESPDKKSRSDFALWKVSKRGEPFWKSPWGLGRPGWHIECSAMASKVIGETIDVHSGGNDLQFPHHDNELAQAEAFYGCSQWVNYFFHSGHLAINGLKMSKSLKNFITIKEALEKYTARQLRLHFVLQAWDKPMTFSDAAMEETKQWEKRMDSFFDNVPKHLNAEDSLDLLEDDKNLEEKLQEAQIQVEKRLEDNFDTPGAFSALIDLVREVNVYRHKKVESCLKPRSSLVRTVAIFITNILSVVGLSDVTDGEIGWGSTAGQKDTDMAPYLDAIVSFRADVRARAKNGASKEQLLALADEFRDYKMVELGVRLEDKEDGSTWKMVDPQILRRERDEKLHKAMQEKLSKAEKNRERLIRELDKWLAASKDPTDFFKGSPGQFSAFNADGFPTHDSRGVELTASSRKKLKKDLDAARKLHQELKEKLHMDPSFLEGLKTRLVDTEQEISKLKTS